VCSPGPGAPPTGRPRRTRSARVVDGRPHTERDFDDMIARRARGLRHICLTLGILGLTQRLIHLAQLALQLEPLLPERIRSIG